MTVAELIWELQQLDQSLKVCRDDNEYGPDYATCVEEIVTGASWNGGPEAGQTVAVIR